MATVYVDRIVADASDVNPQTMATVYSTAVMFSAKWWACGFDAELEAGLMPSQESIICFRQHNVALNFR